MKRKQRVEGHPYRLVVIDKEMVEFLEPKEFGVAENGVPLMTMPAYFEVPKNDIEKVNKTIRIGSELVGAIKHIWEQRRICPVCGGIVPELTIEYQGRVLHFTCWEIKDTRGRKLIETDYDKFGKYAAALSKKRKT